MSDPRFVLLAPPARLLVPGFACAVGVFVWFEPGWSPVTSDSRPFYLLGGALALLAWALLTVSAVRTRFVEGSAELLLLAQLLTGWLVPVGAVLCAASDPVGEGILNVAAVLLGRWVLLGAGVLGLVLGVVARRRQGSAQGRSRPRPHGARGS